MPVPEGFIMPTLGHTVGSNVLKAIPSAEVVAGAVGTMVAEVKRHPVPSKRLTALLEKDNLPGEGNEELEIVLFHTDKYSKTPVRASSLSDPTREFFCELTTEQQMQVAELRERFRKNEHGSDTPIGNWNILNSSEQAHLINMGIYYVEQLAAYQEHEYYKLGNGGADFVKRAQRHVASKKPNKQEEFEKQMLSIIEAKEAEKKRADEMEERYFKLQERLAALEGQEPRRGPGRPRKAGVQGLEQGEHA